MERYASASCNTFVCLSHLAVAAPRSKPMSGVILVACVALLLICAKPADVQAPLLAYNHFVEALFVLNDCRAGLHGGGSAALISDTDMADATEGNLAQLKGSDSSARAKREAIYRSADTC